LAPKESFIYPSAYGKFRTWPQRGVSTDGGSFDYLRVRAESVRTNFDFFFVKWFRKSAKNENKSIAGALRTRVPKKQDF
jgi:hypothetical protein